MHLEQSDQVFMGGILSSLLCAVAVGFALDPKRSDGFRRFNVAVAAFSILMAIGCFMHSGAYLMIGR